jgi:hypothetical protein
LRQFLISIKVHQLERDEELIKIKIYNYPFNFIQINMQLYSPFTFIVLCTLHSEASGTKDFLRKRCEIGADQLGTIIRNPNFSHLFSEYDDSDLTSSIDHAIDSAIREHLLFVVSEDTSQFVESFLKLCGVEFIEDPLKNDFISLTPLGISYINQIHKDRTVESFRLHKRLGTQCCPFETKKWKDVYYNFVYKFQEGINKSHLWKDQTEYIIAENEAGLKRGLDDHIDICRQCGEIFSVNSWADQWWDVHHKGVAVPVCDCPTQ